METPELIVTLENPLVIKNNFPQLQAWLNAELEKYSIEVTAETLAEAKRAMAELSEIGKKIDRARIDYAKKFKAPITEWEAEAKKLFDATVAARDKIAAQTKVFDDKVRKLCSDLMTALLAEEYDRLEVRPEYRHGAGMIPQLVGISKVTGKGALTKEARENIAGLAQNGRLAQEKADGRMARVEADCRAAGVEPLTREHVAAFIDADDATFQKKTASMIQAEVGRLEAQKEKIRAEERAKAEAEAKAKAEAEAKERREKEQAEAKAKAEAEAKERESKRTESSPVPVSIPATIQKPAEQPMPVTEPEQPGEEQKKKMIFQFNIMVGVMAKVTADHEKVKAFLTPLILEAIKKADHRISEAEVL